MSSASMALVSGLLYAVIYLSHLAQASSHHRLPLEVSNFIPSCAQQCFLSFLDVHFDAAGAAEDCLEDVSLRCICSTRGITDFTVGEGAVQCLTAEMRFGSCDDFATSEKVLSEAYRMCDGVSGAIQPTHEVITASLALPTTEGGVVLFPSITATLPTTLVTDTLPPPEITRTSTSSASSATTGTQQPPESNSDVSSTFVTSTRTSSQESSNTDTLPTETGSVPPPAGDDEEEGQQEGDGAEDEEEGNDDALNTPQIIGVSVGAAAAAAVALVAIILARRCRRHNHPTAKTGLFPRRSTWGSKFSRGAGRSSTYAWAANQIRAPLDVDIRPPLPIYESETAKARAAANAANAAGQESWRPVNGLGLTMGSPPTVTRTSPATARTPSPASTPPQIRRQSKLLPAMPEMSSVGAAAIVRRPSNRLPSQESQRLLRPEEPLPLAEEPSPPRPSQQQPLQKDAPGTLPNRPQNRGPPPVALTVKIPQQSDLTRAPGRGGLPRDSNITQFEEDSLLSPEGQIWRPPSSAPLTAMPYYVADGNGNWVLASPTKDWRASAAIGAALTTPDRTAAPPGTVRGSAGNYSQGSKASARASLAPPARIVRSSDGSTTLRHSASVYSQSSSVPPPLFYFNPRMSSAPPHPAAGPVPRPQAPGRSSSDDSDTTVFDTSSSSNDPTPPEIRKTLTPVVESPFANNGAFAPGRGPGPSPAPMGFGADLGPDPSGQSGLGLSYFPQNNGNGNGHPSANMRLNRPNPNPNLYPPPTRPMMYYPPGQPSPTLGSMGPSQQPSRYGGGAGGAGGMSSTMNMPTKGRRPMELPRVRGAPQPATMRVVEPSPEPEDLSISNRGVRQPHLQQQQQQQQQQWQQPPRGNNAYQPYRPPYPPQPRLRNVGPAVPYDLPANPRPQQPPTLNTNLPPSIHRPPPNPEFQSPASERTVSSTASSLLAKRLGTDRAVQMAMPIDQATGTVAHKWRRDGLLSPEPVTPKMDPAELPFTPTWVPKLTPTRRGDDLFLNVQ